LNSQKVTQFIFFSSYSEISNDNIEKGFPFINSNCFTFDNFFSFHDKVEASSLAISGDKVLTINQSSSTSCGNNETIQEAKSHILGIL